MHFLAAALVVLLIVGGLLSGRPNVDFGTALRLGFKAFAIVAIIVVVAVLVLLLH